MFTRAFHDISKNDVDLAGGKGASLGEMTSLGIQVPPGFVVLTGAFEEFLHEADLETEICAALHHASVGAIETVERASEDIRTMVLSREMPQKVALEIQTAFTKLKTDLVAVRSSATAEDGVSLAWAGQLETYLNTTRETLMENVKKCYR